jgi:hypothetical protein
MIRIKKKQESLSRMTTSSMNPPKGSSSQKLREVENSNHSLNKESPHHQPNNQAQ